MKTSNANVIVYVKQPVQHEMACLISETIGTLQGVIRAVISRRSENMIFVDYDPDYYDLVILDQTIPRMTGMEMAQQLLKLRPGLPVILYTGYSEGISEEQVLGAGIRALVTKPVDTRRLHDLVWRLLSGTAA